MALARIAFVLICFAQSIYFRIQSSPTFDFRSHSSIAPTRLTRIAKRHWSGKSLSVYETQRNAYMQRCSLYYATSRSLSRWSNNTEKQQATLGSMSLIIDSRIEPEMHTINNPRSKPPPRSQRSHITVYSPLSYPPGLQPHSSPNP